MCLRETYEMLTLAPRTNDRRAGERVPVYGVKQKHARDTKGQASLVWQG